MRKTWKVRIEKGVNTLNLPAGAKFLHAQYLRNSRDAQRTGFFAWFDVNDQREVSEQFYELVPTGAPVPDNGVFAATLVKHSNSVWHLFERR